MFNQPQDYNTELKKSLDLMFTQNRRRCVVNLSHFYHNREGTDLARRFVMLSVNYVLLYFWDELIKLLMIFCCLGFFVGILGFYKLQASICSRYVMQ